MRIIILRFKPSDELILAVDKATEKLKITNSGIAKIALYEYCKKILEKKKHDN